ncbi:hypothetical protein [Coleofasciculus sp. F4-SAH-05]|uniref:hypothetical protein n=1 Tax=Coleofasciculus sp. F4-SAH-05 TaxID=3069525 RepID=UPI0032FDEC2B
MNSGYDASPGDCDAFLGNGQVSQFVKITVIGIFGTKKGSGVTLHVGDGRTSVRPYGFLFRCVLFLALPEKLAKREPA